MKKWEYALVDLLDHPKRDDVLEVLREMGAKGWEFMHTEYGAAWFKREATLG